MSSPVTSDPPPRRRPRTALLAVVLLGAAALLGTWWLARPDPRPGTLPDLAALGLEDTGPAAAAPAPDFAVPTAGGGTFRLSTHLAEDSRPVFLNLRASWCFPCRQEMPAIDAAARRHPEVLFLGVAVQDARGDAEAFVEEIGIEYPIGFDEDGTVNRAYSPLGLPATYLIDGDGTVVARIFGGLTGEEIDARLARHLGR